jgi:hypothetical protein
MARSIVLDDAERRSDMSQTEAQGSSKTQKGKEVAKNVGSQAQDKAQEVKGQAGDRVRDQVDRRSTEVGEQVGSVAEALRGTGEKLREDGKDMPARLAEGSADQAERLGAYLRDSDADTILRGVEDFGRRRPMVFAAGAAIVGFVASRFLRASSERRYQSSADGQPSSYRRVPSPSIAEHEDPMAGGAAWRGPEADLREQLRPQKPSNQTL